MRVPWTERRPRSNPYPIRPRAKQTEAKVPSPVATTAMTAAECGTPLRGSQTVTHQSNHVGVCVGG
jgi:hypothetical protein